VIVNLPSSVIVLVSLSAITDAKTSGLPSDAAGYKSVEIVLEAKGEK
jgi:hypothetical protein